MREFLIRIFTGKINSTSLDDCDINTVDDYYNYDYDYEEITTTSTRPPIESRTEVVSTTGNSIIFSEFLLSSVGLFGNFNVRDTNLVWDGATQSWTGHKSGTSNVYPISNITKR